MTIDVDPGTSRKGTQTQAGEEWLAFTILIRAAQGLLWLVTIATSILALSFEAPHGMAVVAASLFIAVFTHLCFGAALQKPEPLRPLKLQALQSASRLRTYYFAAWRRFQTVYIGQDQILLQIQHKMEWNEEDL